MEIRTRREGDVFVVDMAGRLDSRTSGPASTELNQIAQGGHRKVLLNLAGLEYVSSAGLRAILVAAKLVDVHEGMLKICDANAVVRKVMEVSGIGAHARHRAGRARHVRVADRSALRAAVERS